MFESRPAKDPFNQPWWSEPSFDASPGHRNISYASINCRLNVESDDHRRSELDSAPKKLTWISREDHKSPARISVDTDRASIQNVSAHGRSARFGGPQDSPGRSIFQNIPESPSRRGESVRRIRTPSVDDGKTEVPSSASPTRRPRATSTLKESSAAVKNDHAVVREVSAIRRVLAARDKRNALAKPMVQPVVQPAVKPDSPSMTPIGDSPESDRMVVSYLAEETDRIIKDRIQKLKLRSQSNAADQQMQVPDQERSPAREGGDANSRQHRSQHSNSSFRQVDKTKAETVGTYDLHGDHRPGELEEELLYSSPGALSQPGSPLIGPIRKLSTTMETYLENRRRGSNLGPQIVVTARALSTPSRVASNPNLAAVLREANQLENPSTSRRIGASKRHDSFSASRAALSPLDGNEDVTHSTTSSSQIKKEFSPGGYGEDSHRARRKDSIESEQIQGENGFPSPLAYWTEFLGMGEIPGEMDSSESLRHLTRQIEAGISPSGRMELRTKTRLHSKGRMGQSPQERRQVDSSVRHPGPRGHSQRYEEVGRSLLPEKKVGPGSRGDKHNSSRRSQSCRRDPIVNSLLDTSQDLNEAPSPGRRQALVSGLDTSSDSKSSRRFSVDNTFSSSSDTFQEELQSPSLGQTEKSRYIFKDSSERKHSRRYPASVPESGGNPFVSHSAPLQRRPPYLAQVYESNHQRMDTSSQSKLARSDSQRSESKRNDVPQKFERPKVAHKNSHSLDQEAYKKLSIASGPSKEIRNGLVVTTSTSISQICSMNSPKTKPPPSSPGASFQRWITNQFKIGSKFRSSSTGKDREPTESEQKSRKKSPWRTKPAELFQGITRRRGSSSPRSGSTLSNDAINGHPILRQGNAFEGGSSSHSQSPTSNSDPWHHRVMYIERGSTPTHRNAYLLPSVGTPSPSPAHSNGLESLFKNRRPG